MNWLTGPGPRRWRGVALVVPFLLLVAGGVFYTNQVQKQADHRWCTLLVTLDTAYSSIPPQTELGRQVAEAIHQLRNDLHC